MNSKETQTTESYIREISQQMVPVQVVINNHTELGNCRIIYGGRKKNLLLRIPPGEYPEKGEISVACAYSRALYIFKSKILGLKKDNQDFTHLAIQFPEEIAKEERRQFIRIKPSPFDPVFIRFTLQDTSAFSVEALDISAGGTAFVVHNDPVHFKVGKSFPIIASIPGAEPINALVTITNVSHHLNIVRLGVDFALMSEDGRKIVAQYVAKGHRIPQKEIPKDQALPMAKLCLIEETDRRRQYAFLDRSFDILRTDFSDVTPILSQMPDLIILDNNLPASSTVMSRIKKHKIFKHIPLLILDPEKKGKGEGFPQEARLMTGAFGEKRLFKTINQIVEQSSTIKELKEKQLMMLSGKPINVIVVDRFGHLGDKHIRGLNKAGFKIHHIHKEEGIMKMVERVRPQVIVIDEEMETLDPVSFARLINENAKLGTIAKVILVSEKRSFERFYSRNLFTGFLTKPINGKELLIKLLEAIPKTGKDKLLIAQR